MSSPANTATVETLTAEVRVLMVGNRQITLSVYRQLDLINPFQIEAFGRVNAGSKRDDGWGGREVVDLEVVGRHPATGALVRAEMSAASRYRDEVWAKRAATRYAELSRLPLIVLAGLR